MHARRRAQRKPAARARAAGRGPEVRRVQAVADSSARAVSGAGSALGVAAFPRFAPPFGFAVYGAAAPPVSFIQR